MLATANPFSVAPGDVLMNIGRTRPGDSLIQGYNPISVDLTALLQAHAGQTLRLRFAEVDNQVFFNVGIDRVSLEVTAVPEPGTLLLLGTGVAAAIRRAIRRV